MAPYEKLFIYEVSDNISVHGEVFGRDFIGCWNEGESSFLFFSRQQDAEVRRWLALQGKEKLISRHVMDYRDWQAGEDLKPFRVDRFLISPPWQEVKKANDEILILLDPGVVFGTGIHPTTRGCLKALWDIYQLDSPQIVLDIGTGTGILAIVAAKLGARQVLAIDHNHLAVETAQRNVLLNGVQDRVKVIVGEAEMMGDEQGDMVLANLHFQAIEALLRRERILSKCWIILSGLFPAQANEVIAPLEKLQLKVHNRVEESRWVTLVLRKTPSREGQR